MKRIILVSILLISIATPQILAQSQRFEGSIVFTLTPDSTDAATRKEIELVEKAMKSPNARRILNDSTVKKQMQEHPEQKSAIESMIKIMETKGSVIAVIPTSYEIKIKDLNSLMKIHGGILNESEILTMKEEKKTYQINHSNKIYAAYTSSAKAQNVAILKTNEKTTILGHVCTKYTIKGQADGQDFQSEVWISPPINGLSFKNLIQYPYGGLDISYLEKINGVPLRTKIMAGSVKLIVEATSIKQAKLNESIFTLPAEYKLVDRMF
jgi:SOS-response transcriptional repressor LexA